MSLDKQFELCKTKASQGDVIAQTTLGTILNVQDKM